MNVDFLRRPRRGIERAAPAVPLRVPLAGQPVAEVQASATENPVVGHRPACGTMLHSPFEQTLTRRCDSSKGREVTIQGSLTGAAHLLEVPAKAL